MLPLPSESTRLLSEAESNFFKQPEFNLESVPEIPDPKVENYVQAIADQILKSQNMDPAFVELVNAPYAQAETHFDTRVIYVTKGMLFAIDDEAQLAELIGHEIGHLKSPPSNHDDDNSTAITDAIESATGISGLSHELTDIQYAQFSQINEENADKFGVKAAATLGYNPYELATLFDTLWSQSGHDALDAVRAIKQSHPALNVRAQNLRKYLRQAGYQNSGNTFATRYIKVVSHLYTPSDRNSAQQRLKLARLTAKIRHTKQLSANEFIQYMDDARSIAKSLNLLPILAKRTPHNGANFLKEYIPVTTPIWATHMNDISALDNFLSATAHVSIGFIPVVGESIALYEILTGRDFITGENLTHGQLVLNTIGLLVGAGSSWREMAQRLEDATNGAFGITRCAQATAAVEDASKIADESRLFGRSVVGRSFRANSEIGPITSKEVATSFSGAVYTEIKPVGGETFYRGGDDVSVWWTRNEPHSGIQAASENALHPSWNSFSKKYKLIIPNNFEGTLYEGLSGSMSSYVLNEETGERIAANGIFHGGANQVYIPPKELDKLRQFIQEIPK